jgi:hypothetical protein
VSSPEDRENLAVLEALDHQARALVWLKADLGFDPTAALARMGEWVRTGANDPRLRLTALGNRALDRLRTPGRFDYGYRLLGVVLDDPSMAAAVGGLDQDDRFALIETLDSVAREIATEEKRAALLKIAADL